MLSKWGAQNTLHCSVLNSNRSPQHTGLVLSA